MIVIVDNGLWVCRDGVFCAARVLGSSWGRLSRNEKPDNHAAKY